MQGAKLGFFLGLLGTACAPSVQDDDASGGQATSSSTGGGTTADPGTTAPAETSGSGVTTETSSSSSSAGETDCGPFCDNFDVPYIVQCDIWDDQCGPAEKCTFWANDGSDVWNDSRCVPIAREPMQPGEPCSIDGSVASGFDDCAAGSMCWKVDPETLDGTCVAFCGGSPENPSCADPAESCMLTSSGPLALCLPQCDPLAETPCPDGEGCYPTPAGELLLCVADQSGDEGAAFESCEYSNACDPGTICAPEATVGACLDENAAHCCTPWCDLSAPDCPDGTACLPFYVEAPPTQENVGICGQVQ